MTAAVSFIPKALLASRWQESWRKWFSLHQNIHAWHKAHVSGIQATLLLIAVISVWILRAPDRKQRCVLHHAQVCFTEFSSDGFQSHFEMSLHECGQEVAGCGHGKACARLVSKCEASSELALTWMCWDLAGSSSTLLQLFAQLSTDSLLAFVPDVC